MPEVFGGGVPLPFDFGEDLLQPKLLHGASVPAVHDDFSANPPAGYLWLVVSNDVYSYGGGSGGFATMGLAGVSMFSIVAYNIGSNIDAFSWRGLLVVDENHALGFNNVSDTLVDTTFWGYQVPNRE